MTIALIGHTGFVGSNIDRDLGGVTHRFNSKNFRDMAGQTFDRVICSGVQAVKWWANQNPEEDWAGIAPLLEVLGQVKAKEFTLISTVDVYKRPIDVDEASAIETDGLHAYGAHRRRVELALAEQYETLQIVRLPGLFGPGLKKNLIFDVIHGRDISGFDAGSTFQFYDLARLAADLGVIWDSAEPLVNLATEPVSVADVVKTLTGRDYVHQTESGPMRYDMQSSFAAHWGGAGRYIVDRAGTLQAIAAFAQNGAE